MLNHYYYYLYHFIYSLEIFTNLNYEFITFKRKKISLYVKLKAQPEYW